MNDSIQHSEIIIPAPSHTVPNSTTICCDIDSALSMPPAMLTRGDSIELGMAQPLAPYVPVTPPAWTLGLEPQHNAPRPGTDSSLLLIVSVLFVMMVYSLRHCKNMLSTFFNELTDTRQRSNLFEERTTNENSLVALLAVQLSVCVGILLFCLLDLQNPGTSTYSLKILLAFMGLYAGYYVFRLAAYNLVGYTFTSRTHRRVWLQGFTASQSLLALSLPLPALAAIFFPNTTVAMLTVAAILYIAAEFTFIIKGFRIFYTKIYSLLYFILYLCTLEIIPMLMIYSIARSTF